MRGFVFSARKCLATLFFLAVALTPASAATSALLARGYTAVPQPQDVRLKPNDFTLGSDWTLDRGNVPANSIAIESLRAELETRFLIKLGEQPGSKVIRLEIAPGSVKPGRAQDRDTQTIASQAYRIELSPARIRISANADAGLFYGTQTLLQIVKRADGMLWLPEGEIVDWPDLGLRRIYWDCAHHLTRLPELKRAVQQAAFFKINGFAIKLEGHFQYKSAPALVEPYALSPGEFQELTDYALRYHVQVVPFLDGPAHIAFILKHPEYAKLRAFPDSNYELCVMNPDSYKLLFGMFDDLLAANKGGRYFILSTDEPYYIGLADNPQCNEASRAKELGSVGKLLAEFVTKAAGYLNERGRTVSFWGEYPLKPGDIASLPPFIVNGETYGRDYDPVYKARGIRQMIYTSTQGEEKLFPNYYALPGSQLMHRDREPGDRVPAAIEQMASDSARQDAELMGMLVAAWADSGLHTETFWLGYATITAAGWNPHSPDGHEAMASFFPLFYGQQASGMHRVYQLLSYQAQIWTDTWERTDSVSRKGIWGNSDKIFTPRRPAHDEAIPLPGVPGANLAYADSWKRDNAARLTSADIALADNDELLALLNTNMRLAERNVYNLEILASIARLCRQNLHMLRGIARIDEALTSAAGHAAGQRHEEALASLDNALRAARQIRKERNQVYRDVTAVWAKSWFPRVSEANGRRFLHEVDDVKDHLPDRTVDMSYLVLRELLLPMEEWYGKLQAARDEYARAHSMPVRGEALNWKSLE